jgi:hypothetical protein
MHVCYLLIISAGEDWIDVAEDGEKLRALVNVVMNSRFQ